MKLFILKLLSLIVLCLGVISAAYALGITEITGFLEQLPAKLGDFRGSLPENFAPLEGLLELKLLWLIASAVAIVFGLYGFVPRSSRFKRPKKISYDGPHGLVQIELESVEHSLNNVLARMPEVKKIDVRVEPRDGGRSALIKADTVLQHQTGQNARAIAALVSDYIVETATKMLGLEELATVQLNVTGINVNSRKSSKAIRKDSLSQSANAPVELLEAAPKPMALSAPGEPLGSGPVEEEMVEEEETDAAVEARAVDSAEEESNQAAARSELLEPLSLHSETPIDNLDGASPEATDSETPDAEELVPDIAEVSVDGSAAKVSIVPEPLGDLDAEPEDETGEEASIQQSDVHVPEVDEEIPEAVESTPEETADDTAQSPWAPLESAPEEAVGLPEDFDAQSAESSGDSPDLALDGSADVSDGVPEADPVPDSDFDSGLLDSDGISEDSQSTDSIVGDLDQSDNEASLENVPGFETDGANDGEEVSAEEKKKGWGWFN
jgi:hypothetical protein